MRPVKTVGLVVLSVLATAAFFGASSASAVTMCTINVAEECPAVNRYVAREYKTTVEGEVIINAYNGGVFSSVVKCKLSRVFFETTATSGSPLPGLIKFFEIGGCNPCKKSQFLNLAYKIGITSITPPGTTDGNMEALSGGAGSPGLLLEECTATCKYLAPGGKLNFKVSGAIPAKLVLAAAPLQYSGGSGEIFCGDEVRISATYKFTEPAGGVFVTAKP